MGKLTRRKRRNNGGNNSTTNNNINGKKDQQSQTTAVSSTNNSNNNNSSWFERNASSISRGLFQFGLSWIIIGIIVNHLTNLSSMNNSTSNNSKNSTLSNTASATNLTNTSTMLTYPLEKIELLPEEQQSFHDVIKFPKVWIFQNETKSNSTSTDNKLKHVLKYDVIDYTSNPNGTILKQFPKESLATKDENSKETKKPLSTFFLKALNAFQKSYPYAVGRYDEARANMYTTDIFTNESYSIDGYYSKERNIHMGIDLYAPPKTKVYNFHDGILISFGYNPAKGDYGNVLVVQYNLTLSNKKDFVDIYALYGHLSNSSLADKRRGMELKRGSILGFIGTPDENGGWENPHLHFQLSRTKPLTHDMPGVVSKDDREKALVDYPDPRIVLGSLY